MPIPWMVALKVIPWGDVIEHAPKVLNAARKLLDKKSGDGEIGNAMPAREVLDAQTTHPPSLGELKNRLIAAQHQIDRQAKLQEKMAPDAGRTGRAKRAAGGRGGGAAHAHPNAHVGPGRVGDGLGDGWLAAVMACRHGKSEKQPKGNPTDHAA